MKTSTLGDLDVHRLGENVEHHLVAQFLLHGFFGFSLLLLGGLGRIRGHVLELLFDHFGLDALRHRNLEAILELGDERITSGGGLTTFGVLSGGLADVSLQLVQGVELGSFGSEVIVRAPAVPQP